MVRNTLLALRITFVLIVLTGAIYPAIVTGLARVIYPHQAGGSMIESNGKIVGSELIGQQFTKPGYFHGRPSAAGSGYDGASSSGSNLGPTNQKLIDRIKSDSEAFRKENPSFEESIPSDLLTTSASGLDPHTSPASAYAQAARVAEARGISVGELEQLISAHIEGRQLGFLGEPRVNVLKLNLALDRKYR